MKTYDSTPEYGCWEVVQTKGQEALVAIFPSAQKITELRKAATDTLAKDGLKAVFFKSKEEQDNFEIK